MLTEDKILKAISSEITEEDWRSMTRIAVDQAKGGDTGAFLGLFRILVKRRPTLATIKWKEQREKQLGIL